MGGKLKDRKFKKLSLEGKIVWGILFLIVLGGALLYVGINTEDFFKKWGLISSSLLSWVVAILILIFKWGIILNLQKEVSHKL